jgi:hypothetical protein
MDFIEKHWGNIASVLGFTLTIWFAWRAKTADLSAPHGGVVSSNSPS